ncbi:hypothetical protein ABZ771_35455 [Streptomyces globisporus]|uniref:hypothetical protein n=1 Tax=Streptomyces TaxID=1883 RepID=UPI000BF11CEA|nr:hypothetical protein [Streptomyces sp. st170]WSF74780.1 hypothetical protein OG838_00905 [Streptomyces globisporus]WSU79330.1 hypothetical protein OG215_01220 [Streptomyces globisporus]WSV88005.1 hypothetical protein OG449_01060 [Streptomyces globisporus]
MPKPIRMRRRTWVGAWAVLCAAGLAATAVLQDSPASDPQPAKSVSAECDEFIAEVKRQLAKSGQQGEEEGILAFSRGPASTVEDCGDELRSYLFSDRKP